MRAPDRLESENLNGLPSGPIAESIRSHPAKQMAVKMSGEMTKAGLASLLIAKESKKTWSR